MPTRYVSPRNDLIFKRIFGDHPNLLISFLNALLPLSDDAPIESLQYLPCEQVPESPWRDKNSIVDVKCCDAKGRIFLVEMQMLWSGSFQQRVLFEASHAYIKQLKIGQNYDLLQPVYALALTNQNFVPHTERYHHHYKIVSMHDTQQVIKGMEFVFVEIPKFKPNSMQDKRMTILWMRFLSEVGTEAEQTIDPELQGEPLIQEALKLTELASLSDAELALYRREEDKARVDALYAIDARAEGLAQGKAQTLKRLLSHKFGLTPSSTASQIDQAGAAQLELWIDRFFEATTLGEIFATQART